LTAPRKRRSEIAFADGRDVRAICARKRFCIHVPFYAHLNLQVRRPLARCRVHGCGADDVNPGEGSAIASFCVCHGCNPEEQWQEAGDEYD
jgi:hypothetical protein